MGKFKNYTHPRENLLGETLADGGNPPQLIFTGADIGTLKERLLAGLRNTNSTESAENVSKKEIMKEISLRQLLEAGCHFGHKTTRWNPKAASFIYKAIGDIHIIDLIKTREGLKKAASFVKETVREGGEVLFVATKRQAKGIVASEAKRVGAPFLAERWIGGFLTNWEEVKKNIAKLKAQSAKLKDKEEMAKYTKKEQLLLEREVNKLEKVYGGVVNLEELPKSLFIVDIKKEETALREARQKEIPVAAIVDSNANPELVDYPIPANDDAVGSIKLIVNYLAEAYKEGKLKAQNSKRKTTT